MPEHKNIRVLYPINGFLIGAIVTPDSSFYEVMAIWSTQKSTITDDHGKAVQICEFFEEEKGDALSKDLHWTVAVKTVKSMETIEEIDAFIEGEDRKPVLEAINERKEALNGSPSANPE